MENSISSFRNRMKRDQAFRRKLLAAWKSGELAGALQGEGYTFSLEELNCALPRVSTGIRAGGCDCNCYTITHR